MDEKQLKIEKYIIQIGLSFRYKWFSLGMAIQNFIYALVVYRVAARPAAMVAIIGLFCLACALLASQLEAQAKRKLEEIGRDDVREL